MSSFHPPSKLELDIYEYDTMLAMRHSDYFVTIETRSAGCSCNSARCPRARSIRLRSPRDCRSCSTRAPSASGCWRTTPTKPRCSPSIISAGRQIFYSSLTSCPRRNFNRSSRQSRRVLCLPTARAARMTAGTVRGTIRSCACALRGQRSPRRTPACPLNQSHGNNLDMTHTRIKYMPS